MCGVVKRNVYRRNKYALWHTNDTISPSDRYRTTITGHCLVWDVLEVVLCRALYTACACNIKLMPKTHADSVVLEPHGTSCCILGISVRRTSASAEKPAIQRVTLVPPPPLTLPITRYRLIPVEGSPVPGGRDGKGREPLEEMWRNDRGCRRRKEDLDRTICLQQLRIGASVACVKLLARLTRRTDAVGHNYIHVARRVRVYSAAWSLCEIHDSERGCRHFWPLADDIL